MRDAMIEKNIRGAILGAIRLVPVPPGDHRKESHQIKLSRMMDEMAERSAKRVMAMLDINESDRCLLCGACPICGKTEDHVH